MKHLTKEQRYVLSALLKKGFNGVTIAKELGVSQSTVSREFKRNSSKRGKYNPEKANEMASELKNVLLLTDDLQKVLKRRYGII